TIEPLGGQISKQDRIKRLIPLFSRGRFFLPYALPYTNVKGEFHELILEFLNEEYERFPYINHDDMLDCMSRIMDSKMNVTFPRISGIKSYNNEYNPLSSNDEEIISWMSI
ncbi:MAG TPA: hypothetical protein VJ951_07800, partial [Bacteroidales bacterium]|nr:hypothetical protein [Bacteroidales bacterium]